MTQEGDPIGEFVDAMAYGHQAQMRIFRPEALARSWLASVLW